MSCDCCVAVPCHAKGLSAVRDFGISLSYSFIISMACKRSIKPGLITKLPHKMKETYFTANFVCVQQISWQVLEFVQAHISLCCLANDKNQFACTDSIIRAHPFHESKHNNHNKLCQPFLNILTVKYTNITKLILNLLRKSESVEDVCCMYMLVPLA